MSYSDYTQTTKKIDLSANKIAIPTGFSSFKSISYLGQQGLHFLKKLKKDDGSKIEAVAALLLEGGKFTKIGEGDAKLDYNLDKMQLRYDLENELEVSKSMEFVLFEQDHKDITVLNITQNGDTALKLTSTSVEIRKEGDNFPKILDVFIDGSDMIIITTQKIYTYDLNQKKYIEFKIYENARGIIAGVR